MRNISILFFLTSLSQFVTATILPENNYTLPLGDKNSGLSEHQYNQAIDKVIAVYGPIVEKMGKKLSINRLWQYPRVNAGTTKKGNEIIINMYGGYARHPLVTEDGYTLVMCHELGHHLGGVPKKIFEDGQTGWPAVEGQADYFATLKCLRKIFYKDDNARIISKLEIPQVAIDKCSQSFKHNWERSMCIRTSIAGIAIANISADIRRHAQPLLDSPDPSIVAKTYEAHPGPQCRLDTYFMGSVCEVSSTRSVSGTDEADGTCHPRKGHNDGLRPLCWFRPSGI